MMLQLVPVLTVNILSSPRDYKISKKASNLTALALKIDFKTVQLEL